MQEYTRKTMKKLSGKPPKAPVLMAASRLIPPEMVPEILEELTSFILMHVHREGLFRIGGSTERMRVLQERLNQGEPIPTDQPVQDVCTILKRWIRKQSFFDDCRRPVHPPQSLADLQTMLSMMGSDNLVALKHVCKFLQIVSINSNENLMDVENLASILNESVFAQSQDSKTREIINAEQLKAQTEMAKRSLKILIENADFICGAAPASCKTPNKHEKDKKSFTARMKQYGSTLKKFTIKRSRSLSLEPKPDFIPFPMGLQSEERYRLRERKGTITQDTAELIVRRQQALQRKHDQIGHHESRRCVDKENTTPVRGRHFRNIAHEEPQVLEWKSLPRGTDPPNLSLRHVNC